MALSDMAEAWWREPHMPYMGRDFIHIKGYNCSHINPSSGNTDVSEFLNDINCFECLKAIETNGNIYNLKLGISTRQQSAIDKEKHKFRNGKCHCGSPLVERTNRTTGIKFFGCLNYKLHKK